MYKFLRSSFHPTSVVGCVVTNPTIPRLILKGSSVTRLSPNKWLGLLFILDGYVRIWCVLSRAGISQKYLQPYGSGPNIRCLGWF